MRFDPRAGQIVALYAWRTASILAVLVMSDFPVHSSWLCTDQLVLLSCSPSGDSTVVRASDSFGPGFESRQERRENVLFRNQLSVLLFRYPFHPRVTAVACKRSRSFGQKCRWQVTAKHTYTLPMWL